MSTTQRRQQRQQQRRQHRQVHTRIILTTRGIMKATTVTVIVAGDTSRCKT